MFNKKPLTYSETVRADLEAARIEALKSHSKAMYHGKLAEYYDSMVARLTEIEKTLPAQPQVEAKPLPWYKHTAQRVTSGSNEGDNLQLRQGAM